MVIRNTFHSGWVLKLILLCLVSSAVNPSVLSQTTEQKFAYPKRQFKHDGKFGTQYTPEEDATLITLDPLVVVASESGSALLEIAAVFQYPGKVAQKPKHISLGFYGDYAECKFSPQPKMTILADTERLDFGWNPKGFRDRKADEEGVAFSFNEGGGGVKCDEVMFMFISQSNFLKVVNANNVEVEIDKLKFKLTESNLEALRDLASRMLL